MRVVIAECSVTYTGRGDTTLPKATRAIIIKEDGAIAIHGDKSNKPLNYMGKGNVHTTELITGTGETVWFFDTRKENLTIIMHNIVSDTAFALTVDTDSDTLLRDGTEDQLQAWLADHPETFGVGYKTIAREHQTGAGAVDLLVEDPGGNPVAVEVKRTAMLGSVSQILRYVDSMKEQEGFETTRGILVAIDIRPNTFKLAEKKNIECVIVPADWKRQP